MPKFPTAAIKGALIKALILQKYKTVREFAVQNGMTEKEYQNLSSSIAGSRNFGDKQFEGLLALLGQDPEKLELVAREG
ncbi:hypothetical protein [Deinococcus misasensis]|uniref:hypothetical protein n=1 Tax=Deinococcus misasensis TaxID=392413 RepID=UPI00055149B4|nr:hypothetical protein [Deinococcus misasensis]